MIFLTIICFLSYLYFFTPMPCIPKQEFSIILLFHVLLIIILLYSDSSVSHFSITTYKLLQSIGVENFSIRSKLKVCITINYYPIDENLRNFFQFLFLKLMNCIEKLSRSKLSFTFINDEIIKRSTFKVVTFKTSNSFESFLFYKFKSCL